MIRIEDMKVVTITCSPSCLEKIICVLREVSDDEVKKLVSEVYSEEYEVLFKDMFGEIGNKENQPKIFLHERIPF